MKTRVGMLVGTKGENIGLWKEEDQGVAVGELAFALVPCSIVLRRDT